MKILFLVDQMHKCGGLERVLSHKINYLAEHINDLELMILTNEQEDKPYFFDVPKSVICKDLSVNYDHNISLYSFKNVKKSIGHYFLLSKVIKKYKPDIIVHCGFSYDFYFLPLIASKKVKLLKEHHSSRYFESLGSKGLKYLFEKFYTNNVFLSVEEESLARLPNGIVIPNPIVPTNCKYDLPKEPVVISAGRIAPVKGFERLIQAWSLIKDRHPEWKLNIYGDGEVLYIKELNFLIKSLKLNDSVSILPAVSNIDEKISKASIYAMTSHTECFPMVLLEAMYLRTPVIAYDVPTGPRNIIKNNSGLLIENNNITALSKELSNLMASSFKRDEIAAIASDMVTEFDIKLVMDKWLKVFGYTHD
jgi:glycosyltransferase involved in cell wall biosynthesis